MIDGIKVIDDFLECGRCVRNHALRASYGDYKGQDGATYIRVCSTEVPTLRDRIEKEMGGPIDLLGMGYRLNYRGEMPNQTIHSDSGWKTHALILYLSEGQSGTAFWKHNATGAVRLDPIDSELPSLLAGDWDTESKWTLRHFVPMRFNRAIILECPLFHSRYPFEGFGSTPEDGRLIAVAFFSRLKPSP